MRPRRYGLALRRGTSGRQLKPAGSDAQKTASRLAIGVIVAWLATVVVWVTLAPFSPRPSPTSVTLAVPTSAIDIVGNIVLVAPFSAAVYLARMRTSGTRRTIDALVASMLLSLSVELAQLGVAGRVVSPIDVLLNLVGALGACAIVRRVLARGASEARVLAAIVLPVYVLVSAHAIQTSLGAARGMRLEGWDPSMPLVAGREPDGSRRYRGLIEGARACAGIAGSALCVEPNADAASRRALAEAATSTQRFVLAAEVMSANDAQIGPARIITFSADPERRNATLGQTGTRLVLRLRTPLAGDNGAHPELHLPGAVSAAERTRVTALFDRGDIELESRPMNGALIRGDFRFRLLTAWTLYRETQRITPADLRRGRLIAALVLFVPVGVLASIAVRRSLRLPASACLAIILVAVADGLMGRFPIPLELALASSAALLGAIVATRWTEG